MENTEKWENRELGADPMSAKKVSKEEEKAIDDSLGLVQVTLRLQKSQVESLKKIALAKGINKYQPLIRMVLSEYISLCELGNNS